MTTNTQLINTPTQFDAALQIADDILVQLLQDPSLKALEKLRVLSLFYKRFQIGGFASRAKGKTTAPVSPIVETAPPSTIPENTPAPIFTSEEDSIPKVSPIPTMPQHHPAAQHSASIFQKALDFKNQQNKTQRRR